MIMQPVVVLPGAEGGVKTFAGVVLWRDRPLDMAAVFPAGFGI